VQVTVGTTQLPLTDVIVSEGVPISYPAISDFVFVMLLGEIARADVIGAGIRNRRKSKETKPSFWKANFNS
jgi:hypothetical protein